LKRKYILAALAIGLLGSISAKAQTIIFADNFSNYLENQCWTDGIQFGPWYVQWSGFGCVGVVTDTSGVTWLNEQPEAATNGTVGHSALTVGPSPGAVSSYTFQVSIKTLQQINKTKKDWQVGWALWSFTDQNHFYNVILKPDGWELDKEYLSSTGTQKQCYLATDSDYKFPIGVRYDLSITDTIVGNNTKAITVKVSGPTIPTPISLVTYTDSGACGVAPYMTGAIALYDESASVEFTNVELSNP
jgi:hypothetical protein